MADRAPTTALEKETMILDAAQRRFAAFGLNKVTMDEIAADVGMGKASLYYYFPNKEELFRAVIVREQQIFVARLRDVAALGIPAAAKLRLFGERQIEFFVGLMNLQILSVQNWFQNRPLFRELKDALVEAEQRVVTEILVAGIASGEFRPIPVQPTAVALVHALQGLRLRAARSVDLYPDASQPPAALAADVHILLDLILTGLCCTPVQAVHS